MALGRTNGQNRRRAVVIGPSALSISGNTQRFLAPLGECMKVLQYNYRDSRLKNTYSRSI